MYIEKFEIYHGHESFGAPWSGRLAVSCFGNTDVCRSGQDVITCGAKYKPFLAETVGFVNKKDLP